MYATGSTVQRRKLGRELRQAREAADIALGVAAARLQSSRVRLWRIETGQVGVEARNADRMCRLYGVDDEMTAALCALAGQTHQLGWWISYRDVIPSWFETYIGLEAGMTRIDGYEAELVPGLLQTPEYARAVLSITPGVDARTVDRRVHVRMERQLVRSRWEQRNAFVVNEQVLHRRVGDRSVMAAQLRAWAQAVDAPRTQVRVLPGSQAHPAMNGAFQLLTDIDGPELVYAETLAGALYFEKPDEIACYCDALRQLRKQALSATKSRTRIQQAAKAYE